MLKGILIAFFCFILLMNIHFIIFRKWKIEKRFRAMGIIFASLLPVYTLIFLLTPDFFTTSASFTIVNFLNGMLLYLLLFFGYGHFYFLVDRSISARIMVELESSKEKQLTREQIEEVYSPDYLLSHRLGQMVDGKYVTLIAGYYKNTRKGRCQGRILKLLKEYWQLGRGG